MNKLIVLGSVNADHVVQVPQFARPGETISAAGYQVIPGGKGANQAVAAARLGADIGFIACVGDDDFGQRMINEYQTLGMNTEAIMIADNMATGVAMIQVTDAGENSICIAAAANNMLTVEKLAAHHHLIAAADMLLMQLETPLATITKAAEIAKQHKTKVILNPAPATALPEALLANVDLITPNETEAELLTGIKVTDLTSAAQAANVLHAKGISQVMITLGSEGVWLSEQGQGQQIQGFKVDAIDTTAAGDTFNGALLTGLQNDLALTDAIRFAHAAAAISVTRFGAQTSIPTLAEVEQFLAAQA
ncbi:ribokinase [Shewanella marina]|uniref:ribokinase n=1 Tax=Shewanella marina TaxID=487319 RepID=UPI00047299C6|nr:ribokinase [Shewanella marina]